MVKNLRDRRNKFYEQQGAFSSSSDNVVDMTLIHGELLAVSAKQSHKDLATLDSSVQRMKEGVSSLDKSLSNIDTSIVNLNTTLTNVERNINNLNKTTVEVQRQIEAQTKSSKAIEKLTLVLIVITIAVMFVSMINVLSVLLSSHQLYSIYGVTYFIVTIGFLCGITFYLNRLKKIPIET